MRKNILIVISVIFALISLVFTVLPLDTIAIAPIIPTALFAYLALRDSQGKQWHTARLLLIISGLLFVAVTGKTLLAKDEVETDMQFEQKKAESERQTTKELEELEGLE